jgi:hypothetical protein
MNIVKKAICRYRYGNEKQPRRFFMLLAPACLGIALRGV